MNAPRDNEALRSGLANKRIRADGVAIMGGPVVAPVLTVFLLQALYAARYRVKV